MSEISKARERILIKRITGSQIDEKESIPQKKYPRKFTVSSLTNQFEHKLSVDQISPSYQMSRNNTGQLMMNFPESPIGIKSQRDYISRAKQNTPQMKTINIKINEVSKLETPASGRQLDESINQNDQSMIWQSPPKVMYTKLLHRQKMDVMVAPPQPRRHHSPYKPRECLLQWAEQYISQQKVINRSYVDEYFPPERTIVFNKKILYQQQGLKFQRLSRIYHNDIEIVQNCQPTYLCMGKYTNPYLYSALAILAEQPARILSLFGGQQANEDGIYYVNLCKDGVWRYIIIDDFAPVKALINRKQLLFLHSRQVDGKVQIWSSLLQKAIAKIYGTYFDLTMIRDDGMSNLFKILTGVPISQYTLNKDFRSYLILIDSALKRKHIVTLEAIPQEHKQTARLRNLQVHQAYKILEIKKSGLKIRNYAEAQLVTKLAFDQCLIFSRLIIYRVEPSYRYVTHKLRHKKRFYSKVAVNIPVKTRGYFQVWQNNPAYYKKHLDSNIQYSLSRIKMWISKNEEEGEFIEAGKQIQLTEGSYQMHIHLCQGKEYDFTLSYYGQKQITMERVKNMEEWYEPCLCVSK